MSIQKKSLISSLKTAKKANVASSPSAEIKKGEKTESMVKLSTKSFKSRGLSAKSPAGIRAKGVTLKSGIRAKASVQFKSPAPR